VVPAAAGHVDLGHRVVTVSRPGYGSTDVGSRSPADFAPLGDEARPPWDGAQLTATIADFLASVTL